jgi:hypothetical protein
VINNRFSLLLLYHTIYSSSLFIPLYVA